MRFGGVFQAFSCRSRVPAGDVMAPAAPAEDGAPARNNGSLWHDRPCGESSTGKDRTTLDQEQARTYFNAD